MRKIAIIGGGWYGCYIAEYLLENYSNITITILDKNDDLFCGSSYNNQCRLHLGYHYPRCNTTNKKCEKNYHKFLKKYGMLTENIDKNYYVIANNSNIKYDEFLKLYNKDNHTIVNNTFMTNIDGNIINTKEKYIDFKKSKEYFKKTLLSKIKFIKKYTVINIKNIINGVQINNELEFDNVFNCTYNQLIFQSNVLYEKCLSLIYKKINDVPFDCLTIMDGKYSSIYKYADNQYTLTNVEHTPLLTKSSFDDVNVPYEYNLKEKIKLFEETIITYYPEFKKTFEYDTFFESFKCKNISTDDSRDINIIIDKKIFNVWCGKISFIFELDKHINNFML